MGCATEAAKIAVVIGAVFAVLITAAWYTGGLR